MKVTLTYLFVLVMVIGQAASGGPDQYGYTWKDSNEPGGPVFSWIDATINGQQILGLADDNVVGPFSMQSNFPFYWYSPKNLWIGSNGYIAFEDANIAANFPAIPAQGGPNDYVAGMMADLNFSGSSNLGECWLLDSGAVTVVSYLNVPFWASGGYAGVNTFQIVLNRNDSTITVQYQEQLGSTSSNVVLGIESITGDIGLQHSDSLPASGYAIRYYNPANPLIQINDIACTWLSDSDNGGQMLTANSAPFDMVLNARNTGSVTTGGFDLRAEVQDANLLTQVSDTQVVTALIPNADTLITFDNQFIPNSPGTYRFTGTVTNVANEYVASNNTREQELVVYDSTALSNDLTWAGPTDNGIGLSWNGGNGGVATYIDIPYYPAYISHTLVRIVSNVGGGGMYMKVWDDDGVNGGPGTLLDSVRYDGVQTQIGDNAVPLANPFSVQSGGIYVSWEMETILLNIGLDDVGPFSLQTFEILGGVWADYRDREIQDFHLGARISQLPINDGGCVGFLGVVDGQTLTQPTPIRSWVKNYGNQMMSGFNVSYQFASEPVVTEAFVGTIQPGDSSLFVFNQQLNPSVTTNGTLCSWSVLNADVDQANDSVCVNLNLVVGVQELDANAWLVAPVPAQTEFEITPQNEDGYSITLSTLTGRIVKTKTQLFGIRSVELDGLSKGIYLLEIEQRGRRVVKRVEVH